MAKKQATSADVASAAASAPSPAVKKEKAPAVYSIRGEVIKPNSIETIHFDEETGHLHTPVGSFQMAHSGTMGPEFGRALASAMNSPDAKKMSENLANAWIPAHHILSAGETPEHWMINASHMAAFSPTKPVAQEELMHARFVDAHRKVFGAGPETIATASPEAIHELIGQWHNEDHPHHWPETGSEYFSASPDYYTLKSKSSPKKEMPKSPHRGLVSQKSDIHPFTLTEDAETFMENYPQLHRPLMDLLKKHKTDNISFTKELMNLKHKKKTPDGQPVKVFGLAPKTALLSSLLLGAGNSFVPDTHYVRFLFGLDQNKDKDSIKYLKEALWKPQNLNAVAGLNRYYNKHHDAVKILQNDPRWNRGITDPAQFNGPAFWASWSSIPAVEKALQLGGKGFQEGKWHGSYWDANKKFFEPLQRNEEVNGSSIAEDIRRYHEAAHHAGEVPAQIYHVLTNLPKWTAQYYRQKRGLLNG